MLTFLLKTNNEYDWRFYRMRSFGKQDGVVAGWVYGPGLLMILLGASILFFPKLLTVFLAGCFILAGLILILSMRNLRKAAKRIRTQLAFDLDREQQVELSPDDLPPGRVFVSYIN
jgi:hypothetical protein